MTRQQSGLRAPGKDSAQDVPIARRDDVVLFRTVDRRHPQPWYFTSRDADHPNGAGRFDLAPPAGTCYLSATAASALLEVLSDPEADGPPVTSFRTLSSLTVWAGEVSSARDLANTVVASAPGLTLELSTVTPYELPHAWADAFHADGRGGLVYRCRFGMAEGVALFSEIAGPPKPNDPEDPRHRGKMQPIAATEILAELPPAFRRNVGLAVWSREFETARDPDR